MEVLHALKGRIDPLFQKNDQDKGEFWFHFVKFKGKLNSEKERATQTTFLAVPPRPPVLNLKYFIVNL